MDNRQKKRVILPLAALLILIFTVPAWAQEAPGQNFDVGTALEEMGAGELLDELPSQAQDMMEELDLSDMSFQEIIALSPEELGRGIWNMAVRQWKGPIRALFSLCGVTLLCAVLSGVHTSFLSGSLEQVFSVVTVLCSVAFLTQPIIDCITDTAASLRDCSAFLLSFIPVFAGLTAAGGHPVSAGNYHLLLFGACQMVSQLAVTILVPLMGIYLAFSMVSAAMPHMDLSGIAKGIRTAVCWVLGLATTLFTGLFSIQTMVSAGSDALSVKTGKFLVGSFVPVVGGALSDAFSAAQGCIHLMKTTLGAFGICIALITFLPILIRTVLWRLIAAAAGEVAELLEVKPMAQLMKAAGGTLSVMMALVMCFGLLVVVCTTVVTFLGMG